MSQAETAWYPGTLNGFSGRVAAGRLGGPRHRAQLRESPRGREVLDALCRRIVPAAYNPAAEPLDLIAQI